MEWTGNGECTVLQRPRNAKELKSLALLESGGDRKNRWKDILEKPIMEPVLLVS